MMKLFKMQFDGGVDYVEAANMAEAIAVWHVRRRERDPGWNDPETPEPDGCELVHDEPVMRAPLLGQAWVSRVTADPSPDVAVDGAGATREAP